MKHYGWLLFVLVLALPACGRDQKGSDERAQEAQKAIQEGMQKEKQMFEGMQKGVETVEKKAEEKTK
jgi:hypothetical protein